MFRKSGELRFRGESLEEDHRQYKLLDAWWNRTFRDQEGRYLRGYQSFATLDELEQSLNACSKITCENPI